MTLETSARAKINLFLHVGSAAADGYHPVCSWMSFADIGDRVAIDPADRPELVVEGPFAAELADTPPAENLIMRAAALLGVEQGFRITLHKALPVASGLGGGSSDAGAALRLFRRAFALPLSNEALEAAAAAIGADGPACLWAMPAIAEGRGDRLSSAPLTPVLDALLVNPDVACSTAAVYRAFDAAGGGEGALRPDLPEAFGDAAAVAQALATCRNDLEAPAIGVAPEIAEVLERLRSAPETLIARLSGSGATCFALCADGKAAEKLAGEIAAAEPRWWVRACRLGASPI